MNPSNETTLKWLNLEGRVESLDAFRTFVLTCAGAAGLSEGIQARIDLVLEEVLLNVFHYAFEAGQPGTVSVGCGMTPENGFLLRVTDPGRPFDPLKQTPPDINLDIDQREIGGLGIFLAGEMSGAISYERENERNVLSIYFPAQ